MKAFSAVLAALTALISASPCSSSSAPHGNRELIINGVDVDNSVYPFIAALLRTQTFDAPFWGHFCGGSLIEPDVVLTAAHCAVFYKAEEITIGMGITNLTGFREPLPEGSELIQVTKKVVHPDFKPFREGEVNWDFALLFLESKSTFPSIALARNSTVLMDELDLTAIGWGDRTRGPTSITSSHLKETTMGYVEDKRCKNTFTGIDQFLRFPSQLCAVEPGTKTCSGDSGGPLFFTPQGGYSKGGGGGSKGGYSKGGSKGGASPIQVGLTSFGFSTSIGNITISCLTLLPTIFSRVSDARDWIDSTIAEYRESEEGTSGENGTSGSSSKAKSRTKSAKVRG